VTTCSEPVQARTQGRTTRSGLFGVRNGFTNGHVSENRLKRPADSLLDCRSRRASTNKQECTAHDDVTPPFRRIAGRWPKDSPSCPFHGDNESGGRYMTAFHLVGIDDTASSTAAATPTSRSHPRGSEGTMDR
jgi:hypothetical protein